MTGQEIKLEKYNIKLADVSKKEMKVATTAKQDLTQRYRPDYQK